jgi:hypothetical protein
VEHKILTIDEALKTLSWGFGTPEGQILTPLIRPMLAINHPAMA